MIICPYCEQEDPIVAIVHENNLTIKGEGEISALAQKPAVEVECQHCRMIFTVQFELQPAGLLIDLS